MDAVRWTGLSSAQDDGPWDLVGFEGLPDSATMRSDVGLPGMRAEAHPLEMAGMPLQDAQLSAGVDVPKPHRVVTTCRSKHQAVGPEAYAVD